MRKLLVVAALLSALSLSACSTAEPVALPSDGPISTTPALPVEVSAEPIDETAGEPCASYSPPEPLTPPAGAEEIVLAAEAAALPENVTLKLGVQVIASVDDPGMFEVVARLCSDPLLRDELVAAGNIIAKAIYSVPASDEVTLLMISPWIPEGDSVKQDRSLGTLQTNYELFLWETTNGLLDTNWY